LAEATNLLKQLKDPYQKKYYHGIVLERQAKAALSRRTPGSEHDAHEWLTEAMEAFEAAVAVRPAGNDDAIRAVSLYCELLSGAVLDGIRAEIAASGGDVGELSEPPAEEVPATEADGAGAEASPPAK